MKAFTTLLMLLVIATLISLGIWYFQIFSQSGDFGKQVELLVSEAKQKDNDFQQLAQNFEGNLSLKEGSVEYFDRSLSEIDKLVSSHNDLKRRTSELVVPENGRLVYEKLTRAWDARGQALSNYQDFIRANKEAFLCYQRGKEPPVSGKDEEEYLQKAVEAEIAADQAIAEAHSWEEKAQGLKASGAKAYIDYLNALQDVKWQMQTSL